MYDKAKWDHVVVRELAEYLQDKYGSMMTIQEVGEEINLKDHRAVIKWLSGCKRSYVGKRILFRSADIARQLYASMEDA